MTLSADRISGEASLYVSDPWFPAALANISVPVMKPFSSTFTATAMTSSTTAVSSITTEMSAAPTYATLTTTDIPAATYGGGVAPTYDSGSTPSTYGTSTPQETEAPILSGATSSFASIALLSFALLV